MGVVALRSTVARGKMMYSGKVGRSEELARIIALPRRHAPPAGTDELSSALRTPAGTQTLRPVQAQALAEIYCQGGLLGPVQVGAGKTLITYLAPRMVSAERPVLLVPAKLREKTKDDFKALAEHWDCGGVYTIVISYEQLGHPYGVRLLEEARPDLIMADECHRLKNHKAAVTRRVGRYIDAHPGTKFMGLSGTVTKRSLRDFAHMAEWALGQGAPVPLVLYELEEWSRALDEDNQWCYARLHPGALSALEGPEEAAIKGDLPRARAAYRRRLVETPGVVTAGVEADCTASLELAEWTPPERAEIRRWLNHLRKTWETPDGQPLITAVDVWRHARELVQGFWYRWDPPPPAAWLSARRAWAAVARGVLSRSRSLDTEAQAREALAGHPALTVWEDIQPEYSYTLRAEWFDLSIMREAVAWAQCGGIVWVGDQTVGSALDTLGLPYYGAQGLRGSDRIDWARGGIAASIAANSEGRNLQAWCRNLVLSPPTTGDRWEQLIGRTHRLGQASDDVTVEVYLGCKQTKDGMGQALSDSRYAASVLGTRPKLLLATNLIRGIS